VEKTLEQNLDNSEERDSLHMESGDGGLEYKNRDDLAEQTPWLSPNGRCKLMAQWVVDRYENSEYMSWNTSVKEWVRQSKIILENYGKD